MDGHLDSSQAHLVMYYFFFQGLTLGIFSFFKTTSGQDSSSNVEIQLISTFIIMAILAISDIYLRPCLVKKFNIFDAGAYSLAAFINLTSLILYMTTERTGMLIMLFVGSFVFIMATWLIYRTLYSKVVIVKKKQKAHEEVLIYDGKEYFNDVKI